jgi:hypothetical protein
MERWWVAYCTVLTSGGRERRDGGRRLPRRGEEAAVCCLLARCSRVRSTRVESVVSWHGVRAALSFPHRGPGRAHEGGSGTVTLLYCNWIGRASFRYPIRGVRIVRILFLFNNNYLNID